MEALQDQHQQSQQQHHLDLVNLENSSQSNVVIPKELILISLVAQEQCLYNPKHQNYRSTKSKDEKWHDIGCQVGWTATQCKAKWKAMRDQYCRELKRAKACAKAVKWKYFKELDFLRPFALARNYRGRTGVQVLNQVPNSLTLPSHQSFNSSNSSSSQHLIKLEDSTPSSLIDHCVFAPADKSSFMVQQSSQQDNNWNYLTAEPSANSASPCETAASATTVVDRIYNEFVDCVNAHNPVPVPPPLPPPASSANAAGTVNSITHTPGIAAGAADEEDDDPLHTFLNMESYFEKELITLIQNEDMIYNYGNENYRNAKLKMEVWEEIARKLKKTVKQCRQKWKALRDQYAREHKRLRTLMHQDAISRWKHYDSLNFLQKYIQQKTLDNDAQLSLLMPKPDSVPEQDEQMAHSHSPTTSSDPSQVQSSMPLLPPLTGPLKAEMEEQQQQQQQQQQAASDLCVASYDEMDIENYINGDVPHDEQDEEEDEEEEEDDDEDDENEVEEADQEMDVNNAQLPQESEVVSYNSATEDAIYMTLTKQEPSTIPSGGADYAQKLEINTPSTNSNQTSRYAGTTPTTSRYHTPHNKTEFPLPTPPPALPPPASSGEDDEIGAFFKAVAMKIRSAQLEPVAFTDLQIDILRVINEALRNH